FQALVEPEVGVALLGRNSLTGMPRILPAWSFLSYRGAACFVANTPAPRCAKISTWGGRSVDLTH
ncbi:hypothetical protein, partial [Pseudomonas carnis]|uniref:hypothetical protein n=1 Tax=Pseudomonas carnis TaxID=2487355 RepID=UPI001F2E434A